MSEMWVDLIRWAVVVEMVALVWCVAVLHGVHSDRLPSELRWMGRGMTWLTLTFAAAVSVNAALPDVPPTPGLYVLAGLALPVVAGGSVLTSRAMRRGYQQHRAYQRLADHLSHAAPCGNPDCTAARDELRRIHAL